MVDLIELLICLESNQNCCSNNNNLDPPDLSSSNGTSRAESNPKAQSNGRKISSSFSMLLKSELLGIDSPPQEADYAAYYCSRQSTDCSSTRRNDAGNCSEPHNRFGTSFDVSTCSSFSSGIIPRSDRGSSNILRFKAPRQATHDEVRSSVSFSGIGSRSRRCVL